tara:strand:+ start:180 stop:503 length:324 start_codon:yes stop_codon:yes gene_type:complete
MSFYYPYYSRYWDSPTYRYSSYYDWRGDYTLPLSRYSTAWDYPLASRYASSYVSPYSYSRYYDSPYSRYYSPYGRYGYSSAYASAYYPYTSAYRSWSPLSAYGSAYW